MKKPVVILLVLSVVIVGGFLLFSSKKKQSETQYTFATLEYGDLENTVSASGTLEPVTTVEVGTQVSGIIDRIYVDYNDHVKKNQLLALLDTTILAVQVRDAEASLTKSEASLDMARFDFKRIEQMYEQNLVSEMEYITSRTDFKTAQANFSTAKNSLSRANQNLSYAFIKSPIHGVVIQRAVEEGQTVASSLNAPVLFLIAEDLSKMEIHALVDESDIGEIKEGQSVRFEVQAHDDREFTGTVRQIWLQPETVSNVVNYTVVIDADNPDGLLLPGMTATLDFIIEKKENVLLVPVSALKVKPTEEMVAGVRERMEKRVASFRNDSTRNRPQMAESSQSSRSGFGGMRDMASGNGALKNRGVIWYRDHDKNIRLCPVITGSTDGRFTEITPVMSELKSGMEIITNVQGETVETTMRRSGLMGGFGGPPPR